MRSLPGALSPSVVAALLLTCGCGGPSVRVGAEINPEADFAEYETYAFTDRDNPLPAGFQRMHIGTEIMERRVERAVRRAMRERGFREVRPEDASFVVYYGLGARELITEAPERHLDGWTSPQVNIHGQAAILVDFVSADGGTHLWHGFAEAAVTPGAASDLEVSITAAVDRIMEKAPRR